MFGRFVVGVAIGAIALFGSAAIASGQVHDPVLIGPNQPFVGLVNNSSSNATIEMACFGPSSRARSAIRLPAKRSRSSWSDA